MSSNFVISRKTESGDELRLIVCLACAKKLGDELKTKVGLRSECELCGTWTGTKPEVFNTTNTINTIDIVTDMGPKAARRLAAFDAGRGTDRITIKTVMDVGNGFRRYTYLVIG